MTVAKDDSQRETLVPIGRYVRFRLSFLYKVKEQTLESERWKKPRPLKILKTGEGGMVLKGNNSRANREGQCHRRIRGVLQRTGNFEPDDLWYNMRLFPRFLSITQLFAEFYIVNHLLSTVESKEMISRKLEEHVTMQITNLKE